MEKRVGIFLFQKNEFDLFPLFIEYYGNLFGYQNIFVYDNGSDKDMKPLLRQAENKGVNVTYGITCTEEFERKGEIIGNLMNRYMNDYEAVLPIDCDEFLVLNTGDYEFTCNREVLLDYFSSLKHGIHRISQLDRLKNYFSSHTLFYKNTTIAGKLFFRKHFIQDLHFGYHKCKGYHSSGWRLPEKIEKLPDSKLCFLELHNKPYELYYKHSYSKMHNRVDINDEEKLTNYIGRGRHIVRYLGNNGKHNYYSDFNNKQYIYTSILEKVFSNMDSKVPTYLTKVNGKNNLRPTKVVI